MKQSKTIGTNEQQKKIISNLFVSDISKEHAIEAETQVRFLGFETVVEYAEAYIKKEGLDMEILGALARYYKGEIETSTSENTVKLRTRITKEGSQ